MDDAQLYKKSTVKSEKTFLCFNAKLIFIGLFKTLLDNSFLKVFTHMGVWPEEVFQLLADL